ncbi:biotin-dependent carboxyltransferase family protein [Leifsonia shinshuensis]|uniref:5-oxoprolinase subunit C family protein n=1 Tax=Leifsonia shinshuensis TaxID=150026 RepID=UPI001F514123|nr:biotin-dependent carboxyltransferase family protein [Leifsonia shinshuensis]MCI0159054.1 biotin-dependent carboxyltransferase family protein [Leifsonia shinshuensis]
MSGDPARALRVLDPGPLALIEDLGRPGHAAVGVSPSGALDRGALGLANRLVGNPGSAAGVELLLGGFAARFEAPAWFAVGGAASRLVLDGRPVDPHTAVRAEAGAELRVAQPTAGMRSYLAVRGGIEGEAVLGSRSRDTLSGLGPSPLKAGDLLAIGAPPETPVPAVDFVPLLEQGEAVAEVRAHRGPRADWFTPEALDAFFSVEWRVSADGDRVGVRLDPPRTPSHAAGVEPGAPVLLERAVSRELPSEPMVAGAVQVSPDGRPTVLLADHPVTGGYPVIAVVADRSLDAFAQLRPGTSVLFRHA